MGREEIEPSTLGLRGGRLGAGCAILQPFQAGWASVGRVTFCRVRDIFRDTFRQRTSRGQRSVVPRTWGRLPARGALLRSVSLGALPHGAPSASDGENALRTQLLERVANRRLTDVGQGVGYLREAAPARGLREDVVARLHTFRTPDELRTRGNLSLEIGVRVLDRAQQVEGPWRKVVRLLVPAGLALAQRDVVVVLGVEDALLQRDVARYSVAMPQ